MKIKLAVIITILFVTIGLSLAGSNKEKVLPSWNKGEVRDMIIKFVDSVTDKNSTNYITPENRVAVFDNDGTLLVEKPIYIQFEYEFSFMHKMAQENPALREIQLYKAAYTDDKDYLYNMSGDEIIEMINNHKGMVQEDYKQDVRKFFSTEIHDKFKRLYKELTYIPMVELINYLQEKGFKVFIVTGGEITFVRTISEELYNIPVENIIGSFVSYKFEDSKGKRFISREDLINFNNEEEKPLNIELFTGRKPVFAFGNSAGDLQMLQYTADNGGLALILKHDDEKREYSYDNQQISSIAEKEKKIIVVSMKKDFKRIFSFD